MKSTTRCVLLGLTIVMAFSSRINATCVQGQKYVCKEEPNGLDHYHLTAPSAPWYSTLMQGIWPSDRPFQRSVALLVGFGNYKESVGNLPFVHNDVDDMRRYLLLEEHFDDVFISDNGNLTPTSLNDLMMNFFSDEKIVGSNDRFLFYYSGHGKDFGAGVGYFIFPNFTGPQFEAANTLPVESVRQWSHRLLAKHALFLLDGCATGLGIVDKSPKSPPPLETPKAALLVSGNGSRVIFTATKGSEKTYGATDHSYFTKEFLAAVRSGEADPSNFGIMTIEAIASVMEPRLAMEPVPTGAPWFNVRPISLDTQRTGTFVFLNSRSTFRRTPLANGRELAKGGVLQKSASDVPLQQADTSGAVLSTSTSPGIPQLQLANTISQFEYVDEFAFGRDSKLFAVAWRQHEEGSSSEYEVWKYHTIDVYDTSPFHRINRISNLQLGPIYSISFSHNKKYIVLAAGTRPCLWLLNLSDHKLEKLSEDEALAAQFSVDDQIIYYISKEGFFKALDASTRKLTRPLTLAKLRLAGDKPDIHSSKFYSDDLAAVQDGKTIYVLKFGDSEELNVVDTAKINVDDTYLIDVSLDAKNLLLRGRVNGRNILSVWNVPTATFSSVDEIWSDNSLFSPSAKFVASFQNDGIVWRLASTLHAAGSTPRVSDCRSIIKAMANNGRLLTYGIDSASPDGNSMCIWDLSEYGQDLATDTKH